MVIYSHARIQLTRGSMRKKVVGTYGTVDRNRSSRSTTCYSIWHRCLTKSVPSNLLTRCCVKYKLSKISNSYQYVFISDKRLQGFTLSCKSNKIKFHSFHVWYLSRFAFVIKHYRKLTFRCLKIHELDNHNKENTHGNNGAGCGSQRPRAEKQLPGMTFGREKRGLTTLRDLKTGYFSGYFDKNKQQGMILGWTAIVYVAQSEASLENATVWLRFWFCFSAERFCGAKTLLKLEKSQHEP